MRRLGKRIDDRQPPRDEAVLSVFGEEQRAACVGRRSHDQRVPILQLVIDYEIGGRKSRSRYRRRRAERIRELEPDCSGLCRRRARTAQDDEQRPEESSEGKEGVSTGRTGWAPYT